MCCLLHFLNVLFIFAVLLHCMFFSDFFLLFKKKTLTFSLSGVSEQASMMLRCC